MSARRTGTVMTLFVGLALAVAACSGNAATSAPTTAAATENPEPATEAPGASQPDFTFALPSFHAAADLEALFPKDIGGQPLQVLSMSGSQFIGTAGSTITPVLTKLGKSASDLNVAFGGTTQISVIAFQIKGVPADQFLTAYSQTAPQGATISDVSYGGKSVKKVVTADQASPTFIYLKDDVIWTVTGGSSAPTDALLNEAFSKLP
jgi:hypothetical protein